MKNEKKRIMKILVAGCGKIGVSVISRLVDEGHDVTALDSSAAVIGGITNVYDVIGAVGNATDCETLAEAGVAEADLFIAMMHSDELNMLACFIARRMGARHTIARIRNPEYNDSSLDFMRRELGLSLAVNPEMLAARELYNMLKLPSALKVEKFAARNFEMIEIRLKPDSRLSGVSLSDLRNRFKAKILVCYVRRGEDVFIPSGNFVLQGEDRIGITASSAEIQRFLRELDMLKKQARSVMILGGSRISFYLAKMLGDIGIDVKIIEKNEEHCETLSGLLPRAIVICGDGTDQELLLEEGLAGSDAFVALTGGDEENILVSVFAAARGVSKVITKVNRESLEGLADQLGLESIISPKRTVADVVMRYVRARQNSRGSHIETLYKLADDKAEAMEFIVTADANCIGIPLKDLKIKQGILIAGIIRGRTPIIPTGADRICEGDRVIVVSAEKKLQDLSDILQ